MKETKKNDKAKRFPIVVIGTFFCALFVYMILFLIRFVLENEQDMVNNSYNSRQEILLSRNSSRGIPAA